MNFSFSTLAFFLFALLINFFLRFIENSIFGEVSYSIKALVNRHNYILKSTIDKFRGSKNKEDKDDAKAHDKNYPIFKLYGCLLSDENLTKNNEDYENMSSDSEVEDYYKYTKQEK